MDISSFSSLTFREINWFKFKYNENDQAKYLCEASKQQHTLLINIGFWRIFSRFISYFHLNQNENLMHEKTTTQCKLFHLILIQSITFANQHSFLAKRSYIWGLQWITSRSRTKHSFDSMSKTLCMLPLLSQALFVRKGGEKYWGKKNINSGWKWWKIKRPKSFWRMLCLDESYSNELCWRCFTQQLCPFLLFKVEWNNGVASVCGLGVRDKEFKMFVCERERGGGRERDVNSIRQVSWLMYLHQLLWCK